MPARHIRKYALPPGGHVFQPTGTIFKLLQGIIRTNLLTKFHEDQATNVASIVEMALPPGSHVFQATRTILELVKDIIGTNLLTLFHNDQTINVAFKVKNAQALWQPCFSTNWNHC
ncbi:hypothetical protein DPMN_074133 [Dreissena polymorpha]|uniref:Uncharacterized protein n=1 Tax=Dreissena polymorpha TaxID=45954 RepID=A0A9D3YEN7_DREPO|nr:hypothetical protein DPMN_074133 [Dreissena polymorpha]